MCQNILTFPYLLKLTHISRLPLSTIFFRMPFLSPQIELSTPFLCAYDTFCLLCLSSPYNIIMR